MKQVEWESGNETRLEPMIYRYVVLPLGADTSLAISWPQ
jgi:hypothetical protein